MIRGVFPVFALVALIFINEATFSNVERGNTERGSRNRSGGKGKHRNESPTVEADAPRPDHPPCASTRDVCQNFNVELANAINDQIREELNASYIYQSMGSYFNRDDQALRGFGKFFNQASLEERDHAQKLIDYMNDRGGILDLNSIPRPPNTEWGTGAEAIATALAMEHFINGKLLDLHWLAQNKNDPHLQNFLEGDYLTEQVDAIKQLADYSTILNRMGANPVGLHIFDQELYEGKR